jgi:hypothetical protein
MLRLNHSGTIAALVALDGADLPGRVDALVDAYLVGFGAAQTAVMRRSLADKFLTAAPFSERSYRVWRRILREEDAVQEVREAKPWTPSAMLLPAIDLIG